MPKFHSQSITPLMVESPKFSKIVSTFEKKVKQNYFLQNYPNIKIFEKITLKNKASLEFSFSI